MYLTPSARVWSRAGAVAFGLGLIALAIPGAHAAVFFDAPGGWFGGAVGLGAMVVGAAMIWRAERLDRRTAAQFRDDDPESNPDSGTSATDSAR